MKDIVRILMICLICCMTPMAVLAADDDVLGAPVQKPGELQQKDSRRTEFANMYYKRCMSVPTPDISPATQDMTCMCHTVHMVDTLEISELELMGTGKGNMSVNPKRLNVGVYAPCVEFAIVEIEENRCYTDRRVTGNVKFEGQISSVCDCMAENIGQMVRETAVPQVDALNARPHGLYEDPVSAIRSSYVFTKERNRILRACLDQYVKLP